MVRYTSIIVSALIVLCSPLMTAMSHAEGGKSTSPKLNSGRKWRVGYYEGGPYQNYPSNLRTMVAGLAKLGWMAPLKIPAVEDATASKPVWDYLVRHTQSGYIEFLADAYWSAQWSVDARKSIKKEIIQRLKAKKNIDFMIAMGTWAGQDLANYNHSTNTMAMSVSDPVRAGISASTNDSGIDHIHARCDPTRYIRQLRLFHRLIGFKNLGVIFENTPEGKTYAAIDDIQTVSKERHFNVITCEVPISDTDAKEATNQIIQCHRDLAEKVDAVYMTLHTGIDTKRMDELLAPLITKKIPTWSQRGPNEVEKGVLFSISRGGFKAAGKFHAEVMAQIFNGKKPRDIDQVFEDPKLIAINKRTAALIGYKIPKSILRIADAIYDTDTK